MERLIKTGEISPRNASQSRNARIGLGFEKLDRDAFDPEKAYDKMAETGVKWVRIQSGWQKTEQAPGIYDYAWLDSIADNLLRRGMTPWMCLCYGNPLYDERAAAIVGSVGCPPVHSPRARQAWLDYVRRTVTHYAGRVTHFEIWNEPDGVWCWKHGVKAEEYADFAIDTARAVKEANPGAQVIAGSISQFDLQFIGTALARGLAQYMDALSYHYYTHDERLSYEFAVSLKALLAGFDPKIKIIQGESGAPSESTGHGAIARGAWTPLKQAKLILRRVISDLAAGAAFTSVFTCVDMNECLSATVADKNSVLKRGYFGILSADFDENGRASGTYTPKPSYYAMRNLCSLFQNDPVCTNLPVLLLPEGSGRMFEKEPKGFELSAYGFRSGGGAAYVYWNPVNLMNRTYDGTLTIQAAALPGEIRLIDLLCGGIYEFPHTMIEYGADGVVLLKNIPVKEYPLALVFGDFME